MKTRRSNKPIPLFDELVLNAFDFLERAIQQFTTEPKYSVINFCAAIELLLKARLLHEHWSLVVSTKGHPDINHFKSGNFKSISFSDLMPRIEAITGERLPDEAQKCFAELANHRNKMIHFFHEAHARVAKKDKLKEAIAIEQCNGWFFLRRLLEKWHPIFKKYEKRIEDVNLSMKAHEIYLNTVFERIKPEIQKAVKEGVKFDKCPRCKYQASEEAGVTKYLFAYKCRVCLYERYQLKVPCNNEDCKGIIAITSDDPDQKLICSTCEEEMSNSDVSDVLDTEYSDHGSYTQKNCGECGEMDCVIEHEDFYICTNCFTISKLISYCGWCSEGQLGGGDMEFSFQTGCEFCDGRAGWDTD